jgi:hypothetical protein
MHSLLGACALEKGDLEPAATHYRRSWELAGDHLARVFACVGLLRCYQRQSRGEPFQAMLHELCDLLRQVTLPAECVDALRAVLESCPAESRSKEVEHLLDLVGRASPA